jgi:hypothetical protein
MKDWILAFVISCIIVGFIAFCVYYKPIGVFGMVMIGLFTVLTICIKQIITEIR